MNPEPLDYRPMIPTVQDHARLALLEKLDRSLQAAGWRPADIARDEQGYQLRVSRPGTHWCIEATTFEELVITAAATFTELSWLAAPPADDPLDDPQ